jgi:hypothetical protein
VVDEVGADVGRDGDGAHADGKIRVGKSQEVDHISGTARIEPPPPNNPNGRAFFNALGRSELELGLWLPNRQVERT